MTDANKESVHDYDTLWKLIPVEGLQEWLSGILPKLESIGDPLPTELYRIQERHIDGAFKCIYNGELAILHIEFQSTMNKTLPWRMFEYAYLIKSQQISQTGRDIPVIQVVIWAITSGSQTTPASRYENRTKKSILSTWEYQEYHFYPMDPESASLVELAFSPLVVNFEQMGPIIRTLIQKAPLDQRHHYLAYIVLLSTWRMSDHLHEIEDLIEKAGVPMSVMYDNFENSRVGQYLLSKGIAEGKQAGIAEGKQAGIAEGKQAGIAEGKLELLTKQWKKKFGNISAEVELALQNALPETVEHISDNMIDPTYTLEQARADLGV
jgi:hypothetical protein